MWLPIVLALQIAAPAKVPPRLALLHAWIDAVERHEPGATDGPLARIRAVNANELQSIRRDLNSVLALLRNPKLNRFLPPVESGPPTVGTVVYEYEELDSLRELARGIRERGGSNRFLKRAAVLHSDLAILAPPLQINAVPVQATALRQMSAAFSDGEQVGFNDSVGHWEMARRLLDAVTPPPPRDEQPAPGTDDDVRLWYRAASAVMLATRVYPLPHFARAVELFPADAPLLFMAGSLYEALSSSSIQGAMPSAKLAGLTIRVGSERDELARAENMLRRAIAIDPAFIEARLRLGRVIGRLGRTADAVRELAAAADAATEPLMQYYAALFLGHELATLGQLDASRAAYERAAALFPKASAPWLGLSALDVRAGHLPESRTTVHRAFVDARGDDFDDPWWSYFTQSGRFAGALVAEMRQTLAPARRGER